MRQKRVYFFSSIGCPKIHSTLRANPFPEVTDPFCRLPLSTLFYLTRGYSPWRPAAVISTTRHESNSFPRIFKGRRERAGHLTKNEGALPVVAPYLQIICFQG